MIFIALIIGFALGVAAVLIYRSTQKGKRAFFKAQLEEVNRSIWGAEFALYSTRYEHEKTRQLYEQGQSQLEQVNARLKGDADNKVLAEQSDKLRVQLSRLETTLRDYEVMMNGAEPGAQYPEGVRGLSDKIQAQAQKREHIKSFIVFNT